MSFTDTRLLATSGAAPKTLEADLCIVGAGAAGITLATALARDSRWATRRVLLVESGGFAPEQATQSLYDLESVGYPVRENYMSRARYYGGSCNLWAGRNMRLGALDLAGRAWVPFSGWPIPQAELSKWYGPAARVLELPIAESEQDPLYAQQASESERQLFADATFVPTFSLWARSATRFGAKYRAELRRARNVEVLLNASVTQLNLRAAGGALESLTLATLSGQQLSIRANSYVLACGGLENARLLLASRNVQASGVGNAHDQVGRYFMDHPRAVFGKVHMRAGVRLPLLRGSALARGKLQLGMALSDERQRSESLLNHYLTLESESSGYTEAKYQAFVQTMKVALRRGYAGSRWKVAQSNLAQIPNMMYLLSPKELMPHSLYRLYAQLRDALPGSRGPKSYVIVYFCEQPPEPGSRVTLSGERDALGLPQIRLHWQIPDSVTQTVFRMQTLLREQLERADLGRLQEGRDQPVYTDASHHIGTTRMSSDPRTGVVDTDCKAHGVDNLFIAGSSVFPCAGHANPTLTIVALALRLADHLSQNAHPHQNIGP